MAPAGTEMVTFCYLLVMQVALITAPRHMHIGTTQPTQTLPKDALYTAQKSNQYRIDYCIAQLQVGTFASIKLINSIDHTY